MDVLPDKFENAYRELELVAIPLHKDSNVCRTEKEEKELKSFFQRHRVGMASKRIKEEIGVNRAGLSLMLLYSVIPITIYQFDIFIFKRTATSSWR